MTKLRSLIANIELPTKLALLVFCASLPAFGVTLYSSLSTQERFALPRTIVGGQTGAPFSSSEIRSELSTQLGHDLMLLMIFTLLSMIVAWVIGYVRVRPRIKRLERTSIELAQGNLNARSGLNPKSDTLGKLAQNLDQMADALSTRTTSLERTQANYRSLLDNVPAITYTYVLDDGGRTADDSRSYVSPQIEQLLGISPAEWLDNPSLRTDQLHPGDKERVVAAFERASQTGEPFSEEYRLRSRGGRTIWVQDNAQFVKSASGKVQLVHGMMQEVTERKEAELALGASERRLAAIIEESVDAIVALDALWRIKLFNKGAEKLFGYTASEVAGRDFGTLVQVGIDMRVSPGQSAEIWIQHKNEPSRLAEYIVSQVNVDGDVFLTVTLRDVTARRQTEVALRKSEAAFRRIFEENPLPMWLHASESLQFLEVNEAMVNAYGYTREELLEMRLSDLRVAEEVPRLMDKISSGSPDHQYSLQWQHRRKDGHVREVEVTLQPWANDGRDAVLVIAADITERKRSEEKLRQSEKRFRAFFEGTALGVAVVDMSGFIVESNTAMHNLLGYDEGAMNGTRLEDYIHSADRKDSRLSYLLETLSAGPDDYCQVEQRFDCNDGEIVWASVTVSLVRGRKRRPQYTIVMVENITERRRAQEQIKQQVERLAALRSIDLAISASLDLRVTLSVILDQVTSALRVDAADVLLLNPHTQTLEHGAGRGFRLNGNARTQVKLGEGYAGRAALQRRTFTTDLRETGDLRRAPLLAGEDFFSYCAVPLQVKGQVKGVLEVFNRSHLEPDAEWIDFLEALAGQAAIAIDNATMYDDLQRSNRDLVMAYDVTLEGWSRALDLRDRETEGHTRRVTEMTLRLAKHMGIAEPEMVHIHRGALLHDMGKMGIPDSILLKPGPLTDAEWTTMRLHPTYAFELLSPIAFLKPALDIPYCHHEKWDGTGYPRGLKGEQIPLAARIFAVVDVWDALRSERPYRKSWPETRVREHIRLLSGKHFDPMVVTAFLEMEVPEVEQKVTGPLEEIVGYVDTVPDLLRFPVSA